MLDGKTIIITGAGSNVGRAAATLFAANGAKLALVDRDGSRIPAMDGAWAITADLTKAADAERVAAETLATYGRIDGLCNTFGIDPPTARDTLNTSEEDWAAILGVNLTGVFLACRAVIPSMQAQRGGAIVNIGSQGSLLTLPGMTAYGVSKAGVLQLTRQIAADYGLDGIRANCVCPSGLEQPSVDRLAILGEAQLARRTETMKRLSLLGRVCTPEDVAKAMLFLVSDQSSYTTGAAFPVEGGGTSAIRF